MPATPAERSEAGAAPSEEREICIGLDVGFNTTCLVASDGNGLKIAPSVETVAVYADEAVLVGQEARVIIDGADDGHGEPPFILADVKGKLGACGDDGALQAFTLPNGTEVAPEHVVALIAQNMTCDIAGKFGVQPAVLYDKARVVATVPCHWPNSKRAALRLGVELAGFKREHVQLLEEPNAATIATIEHLQLRGGPHLVTTTDCGAGTTEVTTVLYYENKPPEVLSSRALSVGGNTFDQAVLDMCIEKQPHLVAQNIRANKPAMEYLLRYIKKRKEAGSLTAQYGLRLRRQDFAIQPRDGPYWFNTTLSDAEVGAAREMAYAELGQALKDSLQGAWLALRSAHDNANRPRAFTQAAADAMMKRKTVVLVGGGCKLPGLKQIVDDRLGVVSMQPDVDVMRHLYGDPRLMVACGAMLAARAGEVKRAVVNRRSAFDLVIQTMPLGNAKRYIAELVAPKDTVLPFEETLPQLYTCLGDDGEDKRVRLCFARLDKRVRWEQPAGGFKKYVQLAKERGPAVNGPAIDWQEGWTIAAAEEVDVKITVVIDEEGFVKLSGTEVSEHGTPLGPATIEYADTNPAALVLNEDRVQRIRAALAAEPAEADEAEAAEAAEADEADEAAEADEADEADEAAEAAEADEAQAAEAAEADEADVMEVDDADAKPARTRKTVRMSLDDMLKQVRSQRQRTDSGAEAEGAESEAEHSSKSVSTNGATTDSGEKRGSPIA